MIGDWSSEAKEFLNAMLAHVIVFVLPLEPLDEASACAFCESGTLVDVHDSRQLAIRQVLGAKMAV